MKQLGSFISNCHTVTFCFLVVFQYPTYGQKPRLKLDTQNNWPTISEFTISNDGRYLAYEFGDDLILQSLNGDFKKVLPGVSYGRFSQSGTKFIFQTFDTLAIVNLTGEYHIDYILGVDGYSLQKKGANDDFLSYKLKAFPDKIIVREVKSEREKQFNSIVGYWIAANGSNLVVETKETAEMHIKFKLTRLDFDKDSSFEMWRGPKIKSVIMSANGSQVVFSAQDIADSNNTDIWLYDDEEKIAKKVVDEHTDGIAIGFHIEDILSFNSNDARILFKVQARKAYIKQKTYVPVDIWSYKDPKLQSLQLSETVSPVDIKTYVAAIDLADLKVIQLNYENEIINSPFYEDKSMSYVVIIKNGGGDIWCEWLWNPAARQSVYVVNLKTGKRILIGKNLLFTIPYTYALSYNERFVYYYDAQSENYFSYNLRTSERRNLTASTHASWTDVEDIDRPNSKLNAFSISGLVENEDAILINDRHDVYELDGGAKIPIVNLTSPTRKTRNLEFRLAFPGSTLKRDQDVVFSVFDRSTKKQGFCKIKYNALPITCAIHLEPVNFSDLVKARDTDLYFVNRMSVNSSPNRFVTADFKSYSPLTDVHPEHKFNWMTSELITWRAFDGTSSQGILYKPEDFDPRKKYPLLVYYYERNSKLLHKWLPPLMSNGRLNIPLYVSNDYLVFVPDIHYKIGWPGKSSCNAVVSGVKYLFNRKYIDATKVGLQGHSFGGFETNYIITHSHIFTAAMSASGLTDFISFYGSLSGDGSSLQYIAETGQNRIGLSLSSNPDLYIENSPIFRADQVTTPLLLMANKPDGVVPFQQGIEFFTALRRLKKKAWLLQYDSGEHNVTGKSAEDFSLRMFQFFNYYLKGDIPPKWMTAGVPAKLKGIDDGLDYDRSGANP